MPFLVCAGTLFALSFIGGIYFGPSRRDPKTERMYTPFIYVCALGVAALPLTTGDWPWSLVALVPVLVTARFMIARRRK
jgi:hypothetical protein